MILAAGLTPAWQQIVSVDGLRPGQINRARDVVWCASGKVPNVGLALHHLGTSSKTLALVRRLDDDRSLVDAMRTLNERGAEWALAGFCHSCHLVRPQ